MSVEENRAILERGAKSFNTPGDHSGWLEIHDRSVVANGLAPEPLDWEGVKRFYSALWTAFPDLQINVGDMIGEGDRVALRLTATGTQKGEFKGVPPTGTKVTFGAQYFFRFKGGKIVERWTTLDRLGLLTQLGALPMPA